MLLDQLSTRAWADHGADWTRCIVALMRRMVSRPSQPRNDCVPLATRLRYRGGDGISGLDR